MTKTLNRRTFLAATAALPIVTTGIPAVFTTDHPQPDGDGQEAIISADQLIKEVGDPVEVITEVMENICCNLRDMATTKEFQCALGCDNIHISHSTMFDVALQQYQSRVLILYPWLDDRPIGTHTELLCVGSIISLNAVCQLGAPVDANWKPRLQRVVAEAMLDPIWFIDGPFKELITEAVTRAAIQEAVRIGVVC